MKTPIAAILLAPCLALAVTCPGVALADPILNVTIDTSNIAPGTQALLYFEFDHFGSGYTDASQITATVSGFTLAGASYVAGSNQVYSDTTITSASGSDVPYQYVVQNGDAANNNGAVQFGLQFDVPAGATSPSLSFSVAFDGPGLNLANDQSNEFSIQLTDTNYNSLLSLIPGADPSDQDALELSFPSGGTPTTAAAQEVTATLSNPSSSPQVVPEPSTLVTIGLGLLCAAAYARPRAAGPRRGCRGQVSLVTAGGARVRSTEPLGTQGKSRKFTTEAQRHREEGKRVQNLGMEFSLCLCASVVNSRDLPQDL